MPYEYKKKQDCRQKSGDKGTYVTKKKGAKSQKCWKSEEAYKRSTRARHAAEADIDDSAETIQELRYIIRTVLQEVYQSHTFEPVIGDNVKNVNPNCKHFRSQGTVVDLKDLPRGAGKTACYKCTNSGPTWSTGDILEKSLDQLEPM